MVEICPPNTVAIIYPTPGPMNANPSMPDEKWYTSEKRLGNVANMSMFMPYILRIVRIADILRFQTPDAHMARYRLKMKQIKL